MPVYPVCCKVHLQAHTPPNTSVNASAAAALWASPALAHHSAPPSAYAHTTTLSIPFVPVFALLDFPAVATPVRLVMTESSANPSIGAPAVSATMSPVVAPVHALALPRPSTTDPVVAAVSPGSTTKFSLAGYMSATRRTTAHVALAVRSAAAPSPRAAKSSVAVPGTLAPWLLGANSLGPAVRQAYA